MWPTDRGSVASPSVQIAIVPAASVNQKPLEKRSNTAARSWHFAGSRHSWRDSQKTHGNPVRRTVCRKTDDFLPKADGNYRSIDGNPETFEISGRHRVGALTSIAGSRHEDHS
jgi:hypothetical protein